MTDGRCEALSGIGGTDGNVVYCFSGEPDPVRATATAVRRSAVPVVAILGGEALGWAQVMVDMDLSCVGSVAFMHLPTGHIGEDWRDDGVRRLRAEDLPEARAVVGAAYAAGSPMSQIALPEEVASSPVWAAWGLFVAGSLASVVTTTVDGDTVGVWSMSTPTVLQRRGYGRRLLRAALAEITRPGADPGHAGDRRADGGRVDRAPDDHAPVDHAPVDQVPAERAERNHVLLYASPSGEGLYRSLGFEVVEHWQGWSRARWIPGRA